MVNVDTVYQTVQALANKEQRGYLTPQEFNLFANQAQQNIFEQYFYDLNAFRLRSVQMGVGEDSHHYRQNYEEHEIGDSQSIIRNKLAQTTGVTYSNTTPLRALSGARGCELLPPGFLHYGKIFINNFLGERIIAKKIKPDELYSQRASRWHKQANIDEFVYWEDGFNRVEIHNGNQQILGGPGALQCSCETISGKPGLVYWGYTIVNEEAVYNPATSKNFDLVDSEQSDLVIKILKLAGVSIEDGQLAQIAAAEDQLNLQQENK